MTVSCTEINVLS